MGGFKLFVIYVTAMSDIRLAIWFCVRWDPAIGQSGPEKHRATSEEAFCNFYNVRGILDDGVGQSDEMRYG
jgi:hypothetical protein